MTTTQELLASSPAPDEQFYQPDPALVAYVSHMTDPARARMNTDSALLAAAQVPPETSVESNLKTSCFMAERRRNQDGSFYFDEIKAGGKLVAVGGLALALVLGVASRVNWGVHEVDYLSIKDMKTDLLSATAKLDICLSQIEAHQVDAVSVKKVYSVGPISSGILSPKFTSTMDTNITEKYCVRLSALTYTETDSGVILSLKPGTVIVGSGYITDPTIPPFEHDGNFTADLAQALAFKDHVNSQILHEIIQTPVFKDGADKQYQKIDGIALAEGEEAVAVNCGDTSMEIPEVKAGITKQLAAWFVGFVQKYATDTNKANNTDKQIRWSTKDIKFALPTKTLSAPFKFLQKNGVTVNDVTYQSNYHHLTQTIEGASNTSVSAQAECNTDKLRVGSVS